MSRYSPSRVGAVPTSPGSPSISISAPGGGAGASSSSRTRSRTLVGHLPSQNTASYSLRVATSGEGIPSFNRSKSVDGLGQAAALGGSSSGVNGGNQLSAANLMSIPSSSSKGKRARSSSILSIHEIKDNADDDLDQSAFANLNADWVNYKGAWLIHVVLIAIGKVLVDSIPGIAQDTSWTIVLQGYLLATYIMFHFVEGVPFESNSGVYDRLTMWEQIDGGAQYTPAKKWLSSLPIILFLLSTHYTRYDHHPALFTLNLVSLVALALIPKLPQLHRQRVTFGAPLHSTDDGDVASGTHTPVETAMQRAQLPPVIE